MTIDKNDDKYLSEQYTSDGFVVIKGNITGKAYVHVKETISTSLKVYIFIYFHTKCTNKNKFV